MNSIMKNSINYAFRDGKSPERIAKELGFDIDQVEKVLFPNGKGRKTSVIVVRKRAPLSDVREELRRCDERIKKFTELKCLLEAKLATYENNKEKSNIHFRNS